MSDGGAELMGKTERLSFLIVDDDPGDRGILTKLLKKSFPKCTVQEAQGAETAREIPDGSAFTVVFLDFVMPKVDGLSLLRQLMHRWQQTPFVMVSGQGNERIAADAIKFGAIDYLPKEGLDGEILKRVVLGAIEKKTLRLRLEQFVAELRAFAGMLVHDIRAPIRQIRFQCNEVYDGVRSGDRTQVLDNLIGIDRSCERMNSLLVSLVQHIDADDPGEMCSVDVEDILRQCIEDLSDEIARYNAVVTLGALPRAHGDPVHLQRVFQKLIENALVFRSERRPEISIRGYVTESGSLHYSVSDNGIGIEEPYHEEIFTAFRRLNASDEYLGRGLGLATCRKIVRRHGGSIWCESKPGTGSTFHVELPRRVSVVPSFEGSELSRLTRLLGEPYETI